jgi:hypothetical protein
MSEQERVSPNENHLDSRVRKTQSIQSKDLEKLKKVYKYFNQLKTNSFNLALYPEILKKLQARNQAFKKLLGYNCEAKESPINKYLDDIWAKRFKD